MGVIALDELKHEYTVDGVRVQRSVTQLLQSVGLIDFSAVPQPILLAARDRGTACHRAMHYWLEDDLDVGEFCGSFPEYAPFLQAGITFVEQRRFTPMLCEYRVASRKHWFAGTFDVLGELDGEGALVDFATGDPSDVCKQLQTSAYLGAAFEWAIEDPVLADALKRFRVIHRYALRLRKDASFTVERYDDPRDYSDFLTLVHARQVVARHKAETADWLVDAA